MFSPHFDGHDHHHAARRIYPAVIVRCANSAGIRRTTWRRVPGVHAGAGGAVGLTEEERAIYARWSAEVGIRLGMLATAFLLAGNSRFTEFSPTHPGGTHAGTRMCASGLRIRRCLGGGNRSTPDVPGSGRSRCVCV